tara:strand:- start:47 stop:190 length:144 start_codon:yes stop_codon:yes gene_type:complete
MERKRVRLSIAIQKRSIKKVNNDTEDIRKAFIAGWKQGAKYSEKLEE